MMYYALKIRLVDKLIPVPVGITMRPGSGVVEENEGEESVMEVVVGSNLGRRSRGVHECPWCRDCK